ncbi:MAG TPA: imidazolonepropionase [Sediminibacterium sp.]|nr:imidazolonepropionase [Sediminibacterium sp.]
MNTLITHIDRLVNVRTDSPLLRGEALSELPVLEQAFLYIRDDRIADYGPMQEIERLAPEPRETISGAGSSIFPCWCDSHTHLVFAASREEEFVDKIKGLSYAEIAARGGGILHSARKLQETPEHVLFDQAWNRLQELMLLGTGAVEIKSGYGLTVDAELKMLRVIAALKKQAPIPIKATFLGAHAYPPVYKNDHAGYLEMLENQLLPLIKKEALADYIDVFCEQGFFSPEETDRICKAGIAMGLRPRIHTNQFSLSGGVAVGVQNNAISVDHLECMDQSAMDVLAHADTMGTLLPTAAFFLRLPMPSAREMIQKGCALALASDYNPGSSPGGNMHLVISMACIQMRMLPEEAINAATLNGAHAMELGDELGSITIGKKANLIFTKPIPSVAYLPYAIGSSLIKKVMINGEFI